ncbi:inactive rhomboid protein 1-like isoform X2 [Helicoverpa armigera]|uniref:inactive rhomboid protein 1-like isoform X2 n=1 Tax=Helicoverpa armigera TaxID=29058 RepID=UPI0021111F31|nr:inactive rhomboid protein 1 isoform X3 [Helicoverpa armigera]
MGEEYARSPCERFPATGAFSVAPPERLSPPPPAPLPDRFSASPRRVRRCAEAERARRPRYVPPAAHVPVERYVPRPPAPLRPPPPVYCGLACRPPPPAPRKCCGPACREDIAGSPPPSRYVEYVGAAAARRLACTPPPPPPPALQLPCEPQEPPCCVQARRRPQPPHDWRSSAGLLAPQLACQSSSPAASAPAPPLPAPASPPRVVSAPPAPTQPPPDPAPQDQEDGVRLRRTHTVAVRDYLKRETQTFFGVQKNNEREQRRLWYERRRRHAARALGDLRPDLPPDHHPDDDDISMYGASGAAPREARGRARERPDVLPAPAPLEEPAPPSLPQPGKDSVARLTLTGLSYVVTAVTRRSRQSTSAQWSRSFRGVVPDEVDVDDVFFMPPTSATPLQSHDEADHVDASKGARSPLGSSSVEYRRPERSVSWGAGGARIHTPMLEPLADNSNRRQFGMGVVGRFFRRSLRKSVAHQEEVARQLDELTDYRPYFTWWVSTVQTLVLLLSLLCYGFGPVGFGRHTHSGQVLVKSLSLQQVEWEEPASFWLGPRAADLIHLGAKFAPCMRRDARIARAIAASARRERDTACCIRNDDSGCVQSSKADCSIRGLISKNTISTWKKWSSGESGPGGRISGSVCGLDPKFCEAPRSIAPHEWPDDITKWPICRKSVLDGSAAAGRAGHAAEHMACEVIGHPCCIGVHGQCVITTREHCDFVKGYFHEEASLCSQVSCLDDVCGMLPFMRRRRPDQLYRAWTSLFVHAGLLHLAATLALQWLFMRDLEKMAGPVRIAVIYLGSGVAGNMASAIFEPYRAEVGPAGSHFGLLACLIVEVIGAWPLLRHPKRAILKLVGIAIALFLLGLLPWIDNFAHVFGFVFGFLLAYALLPFITFGPYERRRKIALVWVCLVSAGGMLCALVALFYAAPAYECAACAYFTCLPFAPDMCASQDVRVRQLDGV